MKRLFRSFIITLVYLCMTPGASRRRKLLMKGWLSYFTQWPSWEEVSCAERQLRTVERLNRGSLASLWVETHLPWLW